MRIAFLGTPQTALPSLEALHDAGHDIRLVVTQPDRPVGRSSKPHPTPVADAARSLRIPVLQPTKIRTEEFRAALIDADLDLLAVVAYGRILPVPILDTARNGGINLHFSLLPAYRGAAPVQWALARGESRTGVTTMRMSAGLDEGDILLQQAVPIEPREHAPHLQARLATGGAALLVETLQRLDARALEPKPQDHAFASHARPLLRQDGEGDPGRTAREIEGCVRGFDPWPGFWLRNAGRRIRIVEAWAVPGRRDIGLPGQVHELEGEILVVSCGGGTVLGVTRVQPEGRRSMTAADAVHGRVLRPGDRLGSGSAT